MRRAAASEAAIFTPREESEEREAEDGRCRANYVCTRVCTHARARNREFARHVLCVLGAPLRHRVCSMRRKPLGEAERRLLHSIDVNFVAAVQSAAPSSAAPPAVRYRHSAPPPAAPAVPRVTAAAGEAADTRVDTGVPLSPLPPPLPLASFYGSLPPPALSRRRQPFRDDFRTQAEAFELGEALDEG